jgi:hypothetical protein
MTPETKRPGNGLPAAPGLSIFPLKGEKHMRKLQHPRCSHQYPDLFDDWLYERDRRAADSHAVRSIARRFRLSRTAARIIAEVAGIGGAAQ